MRIAVTLIVVFLAVAGLVLYALRGSGKVYSMSPTEFVEEADPDGLILDVRTPEEYAAGHLDGAVNINIYDRDFRDRVDSYDRERPVYLYCGSGQRSRQAAITLASMGFEQARNIGGYGELTNAGAKVVQP
ncbi:MAG: rhodanese-like domain-containing protein [Rubricoccaceae bacterium]|nr:rhodanese-like domain-containing protein [Rubricoccaceae bacterium]